MSSAVNVLNSLGCHPHLQDLLVLVDVLVPHLGAVVDYDCAQEEKKQDKDGRCDEVYYDTPWKKSIPYCTIILLHSKKSPPRREGPEVSI